jgi:uncharacterized protein (TIGR02246 family)
MIRARIVIGLVLVVAAHTNTLSAQIPFDPERRLAELKLVLPKPDPPVANYVRAVRTGHLLFLAGHGECGEKFLVGKVGGGVTVDQAYASARNVGLCLLATLKAELGDLRKVKRVVRVFGMVTSTPDFTDHPKVINGCSDLLVAVFGDRGRHARSATGMTSLPFDSTVEIEMVVEVDEPSTDLSSADIASIRATSDRWMTAVRTGRWDDAAALFTEDAVLVFAGTPYQGRAAIRTFHETMPPFDPTRVLHIDEIRGRGDMAFVSGHSTIIPAGGGAPVVVGRYLDIRLRQPDGTWLFYRDMVAPVTR